MNEALKYEGWKYVFGGASPTTSFDCSGLVQCHKSNTEVKTCSDDLYSLKVGFSLFIFEAGIRMGYIINKIIEGQKTIAKCKKYVIMI